MHNVEFHAGLDILEELKVCSEDTLIIVDDFMTETAKIADYFTRFSHHSAKSICYITQNLYHKGKGARDLSLSSSYMVIFKNPRDQQQISFLGRQMYPNSRFLTEAYRDAARQPHSYLFLDLTQEAPENRRVMTNIFPGETMVVYSPMV